MTYPSSLQSVWIIGASSGIGEALAYAYAKRGEHLVLSARNREALATVAARARGAASICIEPLDVTDTNEISLLAQRLCSSNHPVGTLIYTAGVSQRSRVQDTNLAVYKRFIDVNYLGAVMATLCILPHMLKQHAGKLVIISSIVGKFGTPLRSGYSASKHALRGFFESLRAEVFDFGIRITLVYPGYISTSISMHSLTGDGTEYGKIDSAIANGIPVDQCAEQIIRAIDSDRHEIVIAGLRERLALLVSWLSPRLFSWIIRNTSSV
jgi:dehydrogenase/reductase SDR family protein 7B